MKGTESKIPYKDVSWIMSLYLVANRKLEKDMTVKLSPFSRLRGGNDKGVILAANLWPFVAVA